MSKSETEDMEWVVAELVERWVGETVYDGEDGSTDVFE